MIQVDDLTFTYPGADAPAVHGLSFDIAQGEVFGFLGPSGAGKSTTQGILTKLWSGYDGRITVDGRDLTAWDSDYFRLIGVSFELPNHYLKLTARENLAYFSNLYGGGAAPEEVLALVGLADDIDKPVGAFSKGMKNRLNFARSLLHGPKVWFLDEPTSGLDPVNAVRIREIVKQKAEEGVTVFLTTHDMATAEQLCDRVAFLVDGRIGALDAPDALRRAYGRREVEIAWTDGTDDDPEQTARFPLDGLADADGFLDVLRSKHVTRLHSQETTLEDVFVQVTGRSLT